MNKFVITPQVPKASHAGPKAKEDVDFFLQKQGYQSIRIAITPNKIQKLIEKICLSYRFKNIKQADKVIIQYPQYSYVLTQTMIKTLKKKKAYCVGLIHDIEGLRQNDNERLNKDLEILKQFDEIIVHTSAMAEWLVNKGISAKLKILEIFDYYLGEMEDDTQTQPSEVPLVFAGNLDKSTFLKTFNEISMDVYGPCSFKEDLPKNIHYRGVISPELLPQKIKNYKYGLVWDGEKSEEISGQMGDYLKYNAPHKASLYLAAGIPIIVWKSSALASWVEKNNVGISIQCLEELPNIISKVDYQVLKQNVGRIQKNITSGYYLSQAIKEDHHETK